MKWKIRGLTDPSGMPRGGPLRACSSSAWTSSVTAAFADIEHIHIESEGKTESHTFRSSPLPDGRFVGPRDLRTSLSLLASELVHQACTAPFCASIFCHAASVLTYLCTCACRFPATERCLFLWSTFSVRRPIPAPVYCVSTITHTPHRIGWHARQRFGLCWRRTGSFVLRCRS